MEALTAVSAAPADLEGPEGGRSEVVRPDTRRVLDFMEAWDTLAPHLLASSLNYGEPAQLILDALKLAIKKLPDEENTPKHLLDVATTVASIGTDADTVAAAILREALDAEVLTYDEVAATMPQEVAELLHDSLRVRDVPLKAQMHDDDTAEHLRRFCLAFHDIRAVILELAVRMERIRRVDELPSYQRIILALEIMQIYAPMAHALQADVLRHELEDRAFAVLFPSSYQSLASWLREQSAVHDAELGRALEQLRAAVREDQQLMSLIGPDAVEVKARTKSLYSTMRKLLSDGRDKDQVHDILGLRIILSPLQGSEVMHDEEEGAQAAMQACFIVEKIAHSLWEPMPARSKDYITEPKANGYRSLHSTVLLPNSGRMSVEAGEGEGGEAARLAMEVQIRTAQMDAEAENGAAAHAAYKGGVTDPGQVERLQRLMVDAERAAAERYGGLTQLKAGGAGDREGEHADDGMFRQFDKDGDGFISLEEFDEILQELTGAAEAEVDASELLSLVAVDGEGRVSREEFALFQVKVRLIQQLPGADAAALSKMQTCLEQIRAKDGGHLAASVGDESTASSAAEREAAEAPRTELLHRSLSQQTDVETELAEAKLEDAEAQTASSTPDLTAVGDPSTAEDYRAIKQLIGEKRTADARQALQQFSEGHVGHPDALALPHAVQYVCLGREGGFTVTLRQRGRLYGNTNQARQLFKQQTDICRELGILGGRQHVRTLTRWSKLERKMKDNSRARDVLRDPLREIFQAAPKLSLSEVSALLRDQGFRECSHRHVLSSRTPSSGEAGCVLDVLAGVPAGGSRQRNAMRPHVVCLIQALALAEKRCNNADEARRLLEIGERMDPRNVHVLQARGVLESQCQNVALSRKYFANAVECAPGDTRVLQAWGVMEGANGRYEACRKIFQKGLDLDPHSSYILQAWAVAEGRFGNHGEARALFSRAVLVDECNPVVWQAWGRMEEDAGHLMRAQQLFRRGLQANPTNLHTLQACARLHRLQGEYNRGRLLLRRAVALDPDNAPVLQEWGHLEQMAGNQDVAKELFR
ncbi:hypothetical protein CYMTET_15536 [Cymbomonas tetramitiformis]|uniref:EF-hand domain-containing protein n=1 Tax=Cymbomonas tetramitiformis TaxID=36881 RepID=A0AAE0GFA3_9CHLO|nr:hypothetical protein CYMTET_15536 [Cymbomonas tetramitiformis]